MQGKDTQTEERVEVGDEETVDWGGKIGMTSQICMSGMLRFAPPQMASLQDVIFGT
jgi:hypothetical protein